MRPRDTSRTTDSAHGGLCVPQREGFTVAHPQLLRPYRGDVLHQGLGRRERHGQVLGKSQTQNYMLGHFAKYEKTANRDVLVRNATPEALESRMHTNSMREEQFVQGGEAGEGTALIVFDEGNKLVAMGQYKRGPFDTKERWMEASGGALVVTDRKDGHTKMKIGSSGSGSSDTSSTPSSSPPGGLGEEDDEENTFTCKLSTEKFYAHLSAIMYTHVWRVAEWANAEAEGAGTDGWMARLKCVTIDEGRKLSGGRKELMELADDISGQKTMLWPFFHVLIAIDIISRLLPEPANGNCWKLLELDDECEERFVVWEEWVVSKFNELKGAPSSELLKVVYSKSLGDLLKESGISCVLRIATTALSQEFELEGSSLRGYHGTDFKKFYRARARPLHRNHHRRRANEHQDRLPPSHRDRRHGKSHEASHVGGRHCARTHPKSTEGACAEGDGRVQQQQLRLERQQRQQLRLERQGAPRLGQAAQEGRFLQATRGGGGQEVGGGKERQAHLPPTRHHDVAACGPVHHLRHTVGQR